MFSCIEHEITFMSVIAVLYCFLDPSIERIESQIQEYAHEGLRTLCIAKRVRRSIKYLAKDLLKSRLP